MKIRWPVSGQLTIFAQFLLYVLLVELPSGTLSVFFGERSV